MKIREEKKDILTFMFSDKDHMNTCISNMPDVTPRIPVYSAFYSTQ